MPAWKTREAGRLNRDGHMKRDERSGHYSDDAYSSDPRRMSEEPSSRVERLTRTATSLGRTRVPEGGHAVDEDEMEAVASELDRLLSDRAPRGNRRGPRRAPRPQPEPAWRDEASFRDRYEQEDDGYGYDQPSPRMDEDWDAEDRFAPRRAVREEAAPVREAVREARRPAPRVAPRRPAETYTVPARHYEEDHSFENGPYGGAAFEEEQASYSAARYEDSEPERPYYAEREPFRSRRPLTERPPSAPDMSIYKDLSRRIDALRKPQEEAYRMVREELGSLKTAIGTYTAGTDEKVGQQNSELRRLSEMVSRLRVERTDDTFAREVRKEVAELKSMVGRTNVDGALKSLEHGYAHILQRLDELTRATVDPRILHSVTERLSEIEDAFAALPRGEQMSVLQDRVADISERVEHLLRQNSRSEIEPLRAELRDVRAFVEDIDVSGLVDAIDDRMRVVAGRLDDIEKLAHQHKGLDSRLSAMEDRLPDAEVLGRLQGRLEDIVGMMSGERMGQGDPSHLIGVDSKLQEISSRLDRMEKVVPATGEPAAYTAIERRLEAISGKIEAIEKKAEHTTAAQVQALAGMSGKNSQVLSELQSRIEMLTTELDRPRETVTTSDLARLSQEIGDMRAQLEARPQTSVLEQRISELADAVSRGSDMGDDPRLEYLATKVASLAEQIENVSHLDGDVSRFGAVLARIEDGLKASRADAAEIAKAAAREAVASRPTAKSAQYDDAIEGLQSDLRRLLDAAEGADERTRNTFKGVQDILSALTDRLDHLERSSARPRAEAPEAVSAPSRKLSLRRKVEKEPERPVERVRDRKADFIAAARRAAQAASEEAASIEAQMGREQGKPEKDDSSGKARAGWLRKVLKRSDEAGETTPSPSEAMQARALGREEQRRAPVVELPRETKGQAEPDHESHEEDNAPAGGGGRKRALLFAAAAVVLALGTLQVFRAVTGGQDSGADLLAEAPMEQQETSSDLAQSQNETPAAQTAPATDMASLTPEVSGTETLSSEEPGRQGASTENAVAPVAAETAPAPAQARQNPAALADAGTTAPSNSAGPDAPLAFAAPSGTPGSFGNAPIQPGATFGSGDSGVMSASLEAALPPEDVGPMALRKAAANGDPAAAFIIGVKYTEGEGVAADLAEAAKWYQKAADKNLAPAQYRLASLYEKGRGVAQDIAKAKDWYSRAAEAGNAKAMHNLAVLYAEGSESAPDFAKAAKWFEEAANYGVKDSLFNLGILYARGLGVQKDLIASYKWFAIAAEQGDRDAAKKRDDVANMMDEPTLALARKAVETFKLKTPLDAANKVVADPSWVPGAKSSSGAAVGFEGIPNYEAMVRKAQDELNRLGFETGTPDGQMGPRTRSAIRAFQRSLGKAETGEVDQDLIKELESQSI
ncbi:peptidoglycan-binding protein [Roseibium litorale]|uniref:SEL1-like repeat protein n=1 Tax=Roseibium litorale TaxID=2803841 RepID=A0ABR9CRZ2_9HYPH|nr:peptidoglycan-binding protein [Roseibium litorale]MBD8893170.1 SEL1-like repeat protein [Roseibium litorale]